MLHAQSCRGVESPLPATHHQHHQQTLCVSTKPTAQGIATTPAPNASHHHTGAPSHPPADALVIGKASLSHLLLATPPHHHNNTKNNNNQHLAPETATTLAKSVPLEVHPVGGSPRAPLLRASPSSMSQQPGAASSAPAPTTTTAGSSRSRNSTMTASRHGSASRSTKALDAAAASKVAPPASATSSPAARSKRQARPRPRARARPSSTTSSSTTNTNTAAAASSMGAATTLTQPVEAQLTSAFSSQPYPARSKFDQLHQR